MGNRYRRDDGVGPAVAVAISTLALPGVRVLSDIADSTTLLDEWEDMSLAVIIDAAIASPNLAGHIRRCTVSDITTSTAVTSHGIDIPQAFALGEVLARVPRDLVVFAVDVADVDPGVGLTPDVAAAVPKLVDAVRSEIAIARSVEHRGGDPERARFV
jgi:hydrogenase maturation protease